MNVFNLHRNIMSDYKAYIESFVNIEDESIKQKVTQEIAHGKLWPAPLLQFNPSFSEGQNLNDLIKEGKINPELNNVFRDYRLYKHQVEALRIGASGKGFVVVSGTGSGKSLTYISTILDRIFKENNLARGVTAIIVYPMNALINSQFLEFEKYAEKYKSNAKKEFPIRVKKYTSQESAEDKKDTVDNPPDILLTNYVMLELLLTRNAEENLRNKIFNSLQFLVFDELHTYRGRQGSDVGLLIRKLKAQCKTEPVCIGTSATMATGKTWHEQQQAIVKVANDFFAPAAAYQPEQIIGEYLEKITDGSAINKDVKSALITNVGFSTVDELISHPVSIWLEENTILEKKGDRYFRARPRTFLDIIKEISSFTGLDKTACEKSLLIYLHNLEIF